MAATRSGLTYLTDVTRPVEYLSIWLKAIYLRARAKSGWLTARSSSDRRRSRLRIARLNRAGEGTGRQLPFASFATAVSSVAALTRWPERGPSSLQRNG